jgi:hypothetical protein
MSLVLDVNGLSIRMAHSLRKTPAYEGVRRASSFLPRLLLYPLPPARKRWSPERHGFSRPNASPTTRPHADPTSGSDLAADRRGIASCRTMTGVR